MTDQPDTGSPFYDQLRNDLGGDQPPTEQAPPPPDSPDLGVLPRIIIAASATWSNHAAIERELDNWWEANGRPNVYVQIGDTPIGGEPMARATVERMALPVQVWHSNTVEPDARDRAMVANGAAVAFIFNDGESIGASRVRDLCVGAGIPTIEMSRKVTRPHRSWEDQ